MASRWFGWGVAVNRPGADTADFFDVVAFGALAEAVANHIAKGRRVGITGALRQQRWTDDDGQKRSRVEVLARTIDILDAPRGAEQPAGETGEADQGEEPF